MDYIQLNWLLVGLPDLLFRHNVHLTDLVVIGYCGEESVLAHRVGGISVVQNHLV